MLDDGNYRKGHMQSRIREVWVPAGARQVAANKAVGVGLTEKVKFEQRFQVNLSRGKGV